MEIVGDFIFGGSKITADGDCSHEIKRHVLLGRKATTNLDSMLKRRDITLLTKDLLVKAMVFPVVMYGCKLLLMLSHVSHVRLCATPSTAAHQAPPSPGKNTEVGCHFLLQCMKMKSESEVAQLCPTLCDPVDCSPPGSSIHGIFQARVLEWGAIAFFDKLHIDASKSLPVSP